MTNRNQTDTNETATTETKYQTYFYSAEKCQYLTKFQADRTQDSDKIPRKYQEIWDRNTKYRFGIAIFLVYQILGYRLASLKQTSRVVTLIAITNTTAVCHFSESQHLGDAHSSVSIRQNHTCAVTTSVDTCELAEICPSSSSRPSTCLAVCLSGRFMGDMRRMCVVFIMYPVARSL